MMNRITIEEFNTLPEHEQYEVISQAGNFVEMRESIKVLYELYAVDRFFVEVAYKINGKTMLGMKAFDKGKRLDPYSSNMKTLLTGILRS